MLFGDDLPTWFEGHLTKATKFNSELIKGERVLTIIFMFIFSVFFEMHDQPHKKIISLTVPEEEIIIQNIAPEINSDI